MQRVAKLQAAGQEPGLSACRCVKFGNGPADLLAFNEHCSFTHVVDARNFQQGQVQGISHTPIIAIFRRLDLSDVTAEGF